ncbi:MAG: radical SAM/SPASM domain protein, ACGX system [Methanobrevibacter wolinii]|nr:radical SAM/SPASM domain protein, ACGX system [Methanobrevibacter wolinii]
MTNFFAFQFHITDDCDQRCKHCYIFSEENNKPILTMPYEDVKKTINNCLKMCKDVNRIPYFSITGGDPILHPDFWKILKLLKDNKIRFGILGNPFHLNNETCKKLHSYGCEFYQLSIDGLKETHDYFRKEGSFDTTMEKIKCLKDNRIHANIMTTVSKTNIDEIPKIIDTVVKYDVDLFSFARYCPTSYEKISQISPEEYHQLLDKCWNKFEEYKDKHTNFNLKDHLWTLYLYEKGLFKIPKDLDDDVIYDGCNCGNSHMTILPNGDVYACRRMDSYIGNALKDSMTKIFFGDKMNYYRQYEKFEKCSKCELLRFCRGCPSVSYGYTNDFYSPDPQCWKKI